jgi:hypothetical protein
MNLQADAMTRAAQLALREIKSKIRDEGRRTSDYAISDLRRVAAALLKDRPEIVERAAIEVAAWRKKGRLKRVRVTPDFWAVLHRE